MERMRLRLRRPSAAGLVTFGVVGAAVVFILLQLQPSLIFRNTTPAGGDMGAHVWGPAFMRDHLLPHGRLTGWAPDWYAGFAFPSFYFPLPTLLIVLGDVLLPYNIAFKLVSVLGMLSLPVAAWAFGRLAGLKAPGPACLAVAAVPFLFERSFTIYGGNIPSTLAGEFAFSISLSLALVFLGVVARGLDTGRHKALAAGLLAVTLLCHVIPTFFAVVGAVVITLLRPDRRRLTHTVTVGAVSGLLVAFWALPLVVNLPYTNDMGYEKITEYTKNLFPRDLRWLILLAGAGAIFSLLRRSRVGTFLTIMAAVSALGFRFALQGKIWNARLLPFWFLCLYLLAGLALAAVAAAVARLITAREAREEGSTAGDIVTKLVAPPVALVLGLGLVALPLQVLPSWVPLETTDASFVPAWAKWNYSGFEDEGKRRRQEFSELMGTMDTVGRTEGCGRALWEYETELNDMGTPLALMLLPYWTNGCIASMEGLYFESSATTPFHFLAASELTKRPSNPQRGLPYRGLDVATGVEHLELLGVRYYMAISPDAQQQARQHPDLRMVASTGPHTVNYPEGPAERRWEIYEVRGSGIVAPLENEPVVMTGVGRGEKAWLDAAVGWYQDSSRWSVPLAADGPDEWRRVSGAVANPPRRAVRPAVVAGVRSGDDRISFDVDRPGSPVLVKASYFPNWKASGAKGPWRVTPNLMVVVPTERHVELHYGYALADKVGYVLTGFGLVALAALVVQARRRRDVDQVPGDRDLLWASAPPPLPPEGDAEAHQAADRAKGATQDRGAGGTGLPDHDGELGNDVPAPLGAKEQLGVEKVGAEPARRHDP
ncbi:MAG: hypothetical protein CYG61_05030 [Actinobacteria bacterium]|nr:MAG: hypothetical protein CYG61_05030 [Actinomycetota bacterium]